MTVWKKYKLADLASFSYGRMPLKEKIGKGEYDLFSGYRYIDKYPETNCEKGDVIVVARGVGGTGDVKIVKSDSYLTNLSIKITFDQSKVDNKYFYYRSLLNNLRYLDSGSAQSQITINDLGNHQIEIPNVSIQKKISSYISSYDELIENNRKRIKLLEDTIQRLYTEWFVKFNFPGNKTVKMVDSETEYGMIPKGWKVGMLQDVVVNIKNPGKKFNLEGRRYIPIDSIDSKQLVLSRVEDLDKANSSLILFEKGDILFGAMRPYFHKVAIAPFSGVTRSTCLVLRPRTNLMFAASTMFTKEVIDFASGNSQGSTIPYVSWNGVLERKKILIPDAKLNTLFQEDTYPMMELAQHLSDTNRVLIEARDLLILQLVTGKNE